MYKSNITLWEKFKRAISHAFGLQTKGEIREYYARLEWEEQQSELKRKHQEHLDDLMVEYADQIEQFHRDKEKQKRMEELERRREEAIRLYKDNRRRQSEVYYREAQQEVAVAETQEN
jgi:hypothetical protein